MATASHQPSHQAQHTKLTADELLAAPPPAHPASSLADALLRPKPGKKKSPAGAKKGPKKAAPRAPPSPALEMATHSSQHTEEEMDDDALVEQLLHQAAIAQEAESTQESHTRRGSISKKLHDLGEDLKGAAMAIGASISPPTTAGLHPKRKSRQKERLARRQAAEDEARAAAQRELANGPAVDERQLEADGIAQAIKSLGLQMVEMSPDGHCLFSAIADQLTQHGLPDGPHTFQSCRARAAEYMRANPDEFIHYLPAVDDGLADGLMSTAQYEAHCDRVRDSASWGGEPEILALSKVFKFPIHVVQAGQPMMIKISDEEFGKVRNGKALMISYHRKSYGLGEHYNSLRLAQQI